ncbi:haloacid dehalogenase-like hydrolase [Mucisphaera calidilacus]|uniref:Phosphoserine phosphatase n=1 Tax=Mucisphaera calidilacus TaxID=2527982 RepID=A0A518BTQ0_9BACT|nr:haloacid dehalogenase-like hydrolase [Mucisphaera calidilacus]QDU70337.1 hypothetical protein Pan265_01620 [Mucisphaera calidilacus]
MNPPPTQPLPLFVDLDGTLIATDVFNQSLLGVLKHRPWQIPALLITWLFRGRPELKRLAYRRARLDITRLPYRPAVLELIRSARDAGQPVILATASHREPAQHVADHLGVFDDVLASEQRNNLKAGRKLDAIRDWCTQHNHTGFAYAGDARPDLVIWQQADHAIAVAPPPRVRAQITRRGINATILDA